MLAADLYAQLHALATTNRDSLRLACALRMGQKPSVEDEVAGLQPPKFDDEIWMANCCKVNSMSRFAAEFCLYQPDCRLFCDKGMDCKYLRRGQSQTGEAVVHLDTFCHVAHDVLCAAAAADMNARATEVVNLPNLRHQPWVLLPYVSKCWVMPNYAEDPHDLGTDLSSFPDALKGAQVVVLVHGFRFNSLRLLRTSWVLRQLTRSLPQRIVVLAFMWPSHRHRKSYAKARTDATEAAEYFATLLLLLGKLRCTVSVVAHSLGCRVALTALTAFTALKPGASGAGTDVPPQLEHVQVQYLALLGAAVPRDALEPGGEFPRDRLLARNVDIFYTHKDSILSSYFKLGEGIHSLSFISDALGLVGPETDASHGTGSTGSMGSTAAFDVAEEVSSHSAEQYLLASTFTKRLAMHLNGVQPAELMGLQKKLTEEFVTTSTEDSGAESEC
eukprot:s1080_g30.t1